MRKILNKYVKVGATMPLRLSSSAREQAVERMASNPGPATFHMAEQEVRRDRLMDPFRYEASG